MAVRRQSNGRLSYVYSDPAGARVLDEADVFHLRAFGNAGLRGLSPLTFARQTVAASVTADEASSKLFAYRVRPSSPARQGEGRWADLPIPF